MNNSSQKSEGLLRSLSLLENSSWLSAGTFVPPRYLRNPVCSVHVHGMRALGSAARTLARGGCGCIFMHLRLRAI